MHFGDYERAETPAFLFPRRICGVRDVVSALSSFLEGRDSECLVVIHLSEEMEHLQFGCHRGDEITVLVPTRKIVADALALGTKALIVAHNHPSGDPNPSAADLRFTRQIAEMCQPLDVCVLDHVIFAKSKWVSLRQRGFL